jgi:trehalose-6-phosphate hydrolase
MRGTPYIYMGEEIGMTDPGFDRIDDYRDVETLNYYRILHERGLSEDEVMAIIRARSRDNSRTPMQWTGDARGFSAGTPWIKAADNSKDINVEAEKGATDGILAFYRHLIALRKQLPVIQKGGYQPILEECPPLFAYRREYQGDVLISLYNFFEPPFTLDAAKLPWPTASGSGENGGGRPLVIAANYRALREKETAFSGSLTLQPYETFTVLFKKN